MARTASAIDSYCTYIIYISAASYNYTLKWADSNLNISLYIITL